MSVKSMIRAFKKKTLTKNIDLLKFYQGAKKGPYAIILVLSYGNFDFFNL